MAGKYKHQRFNEEMTGNQTVYLIYKYKWSWRRWRRGYFTVYGFMEEI